MAGQRGEDPDQQFARKRVGGIEPRLLLGPHVGTSLGQTAQVPLHVLGALAAQPVDRPAEHDSEPATLHPFQLSRALALELGALPGCSPGLPRAVLGDELLNYREAGLGRPLAEHIKLILSVLVGGTNPRPDRRPLTHK
jgi:hypothetical protein